METKNTKSEASLGRARPAKFCPLVCLCASHLGTTSRSTKLLHLLSSVRERQTTLPARIHISVSLDEKKLGEKETTTIREALNKELKRWSGRLHVYAHKKQKSQFEHYAWLVAHAKLDDAGWVIFTDDDDTWHDDRVYEFDKLFTLPKSYTDRINAFRCLWKTTAEKDAATTHRGNYVEYAMPVMIVKAFFRGATEGMLQHPFCDVFFLQFVWACRSGQVAISLTQDEMYDWKEDGEDHVCKSGPKGTLTSDPDRAPETLVFLQAAAERHLALFLAETSLRKKEPSTDDFIDFVKQKDASFFQSNNEWRDLLLAIESVVFKRGAATHVFGRTAVEPFLRRSAV
jgi:hypothetical protein